MRKQREIMEKKVTNLTNKINDCEESNIACLYEMRRIDEESKGKAEIRAVTKLELELEDYCRKKEINMITNKLESYTTLESFNSMRIGFEKDFHEIEVRFRRIP